MYTKGFLVLILGLGACVERPYMDLTQPIYLVAEDSFFAGCEADPKGSAACEEKRLETVRNGVNEWFKHFDEPTRPQVIIVESRADVPSDAQNTPIHLRVSQGLCDSGGKAHAACYYYDRGIEPSIVFNRQKHIVPLLVAHELGHALGRDHDDTVEDVYSVMSYTFQSHVVPLDIQILCQIHDECPPRNETWCEGSFYDPCRCPSASFEEGEAMRKAGEIVCE